MMNSWDAAKTARKAGQPGVFITFASAGAYGGGWSVISVTEQTDPSRIHNGGKILFPGRRADTDVLQQAMKWAQARYGIEGWVKIPGFKGDYFPEQAAAGIKAAKKAKT